MKTQQRHAKRERNKRKVSGVKDPRETSSATRQNRHDSVDMKAWLNVLMKCQRD